MIIFLNDDRAYLAWVMRHRHGFVLDGRRRPKLSRMVIHRAACGDVKSAATKRVRWTTGGKLKACSLHLEELQAWAADETMAPVKSCEKCRPTEPTIDATASDRHLTRLARDVLDYVLESAVIHLLKPALRMNRCATRDDKFSASRGSASAHSLCRTQ